MKVVSRLQVIEGQDVGVVVGIVSVQSCLDLFGNRMGEWNASGIFGQQRLNLHWEKMGIDDKQPTVLLLPFVTMRLDRVVL